MDDIRYGVIGTGMMGVEHIANLMAVDGATVSAIVDPVATSQQWAFYAIGQEVPSFEHHHDLFESGLVDALVIATPNMTHVDVLLDAMETGLPILVEKPLCTTIADCKRVLAAAETSDSLVWVGMEYRYMPPVARLIETARAGELGALKMVAIREHRFPFLVKVGAWNRFNRNTGGTLIEKCCHFFDLMNLISGGRPTRVVASGGQDVNHLDERYDGDVPDILDNAFVIVDYDNGMRAMLDLCMFAEASKEQGEISVVGDAGKAEAFTPSLEVRIGRRDTGRAGVMIETVDDPAIRYQGHHHGSSYLEHVDLLDCIRTGRRPAVELSDGMMAVAVGVAAHRSIDEGRIVTLEEILAD